MSESHLPVDVVFFAIEPDVCTELEGALRHMSLHVAPKPLRSAEECIRAIDSGNATIVLCGSDLEVVRHLRSRRPSAAIIVVSRYAENADWIDAIEAGADDYYAAPFDGRQVQWMLESGLRACHPAA